MLLHEKADQAQALLAGRGRLLADIRARDGTDPDPGA